MDNTTTPLPLSPDSYRKVGFWGVLTGALALALVFFQIIGPSLEPSPSAATQVGEATGEMARAAWRAFFGLEPEEAAIEPVSFYARIALAGPILGIVALVLALISGLRREPWRYATYATSLGAAAILFHFLWWVAVLIAGVVLLVAILKNIGDIFGF